MQQWSPLSACCSFEKYFKIPKQTMSILELTGFESIPKWPRGLSTPQADDISHSSTKMGSGVLLGPVHGAEFWFWQRAHFLPPYMTLTTKAFSFPLLV